jgi:hypothetical protein
LYGAISLKKSFHLFFGSAAIKITNYQFHQLVNH